MQKRTPNILMMAAGTGGHIFPALSVAEELQKRGACIHWLGTAAGMENTLVAQAGYPLHQVAMRGLRGKGFARALTMPVVLSSATVTAMKIIKSKSIDVVVGFGGYVTAPGGLAAKATGTPLVIHEQNAVAGMSNRYLAKIADEVLQAFPDTFGDSESEDNPDLHTVGNPVRTRISAIKPPQERIDPKEDRPVRLLVVGGSLGAQVLNQTVPAALRDLEQPMHIKHQCGKDHLSATQSAYGAIDANLHHYEITPFIDDMAQAYEWADIVLCRAGALTVSEIKNAGLGAIFIPLPHAVDDHQTANARQLANANAAYLIPQSRFNAEYLKQLLMGLDLKKCQNMGVQAKSLANPHATVAVADRIWHLLPPSVLPENAATKSAPVAPLKAQPLAVNPSKDDKNIR